MILAPNGQPIRSHKPKNQYEGAGQGPRLKHWNAPGTGPKQTLRGNLETLRNRTRAAFRNSLLLRAAIKKNTTAEIGKGITVQSDCDDIEFRQAANKLWQQTALHIDPEGQLDFNGKLTQAVLNRRLSGEVFIVKRRVLKQQNLPTAFQLDFLESDFCPVGHNVDGKGNRRIIDGIEFLGNQRVAYWFYPEHPGDGNAISHHNLVRVKASDVIHHYIPTRVGQIRGEPDAVSALLKNHMFAEYDDNELNRKRNRSAFTGFIARDDYSDDDWEYDPLTGQTLYQDGPSAPVSEIVIPGQFIRGYAGERVTLFEGDDAGNGYHDFMRWQCLQLASGLEIPYELLTGDWNNVNDRLVRVVLDEYRRHISAIVNQVVIFQLVRRIWQWFIDDNILLGNLSAPNYTTEPFPYYAMDTTTDPFKYIHPVQDMQAQKLARESNLSSFEAQAKQMGGDVYANLRRNAEYRKAVKDVAAKYGLDEEEFVSIQS